MFCVLVAGVVAGGGAGDSENLRETPGAFDELCVRGAGPGFIVKVLRMVCYFLCATDAR